MRHGNTAREIVGCGEFAKVGKRHYAHIDGAEIRYDCNAWVWRIALPGSPIDGERYTALHAAVSRIRFHLANAA